MEKTKFFTENEYHELIGKIEEDYSIHSIRNLAIITIAEYCGLRVSEVGSIRIHDVDLDKHTIYCRRMKKGNSNTLKIVDEKVFDNLKKYIEIRASYNVQNSVYLFLSQLGKPISRKTLHNIIKKYCKSSNIPEDKHHFHTLRHTRAVELLEMGAEIEDVQWWLGHKNIESTMIYLQYTTKKQESLYSKIIIDLKNKALHFNVR